MFPDLRNPLLRSDEILEVFLGISSDVEECLSIDQFSTSLSFTPF